MKTASGRSAARVSFLIFLVGLWEFVVRAAEIPTYVIPAPSEVWSRLFLGFQQGFLWEYTRVTSVEIVLGYLLGVILGFGIAVLVVQYFAVDFFLYPIIISINAVPKIAISPLLIIWVGTGLESKVLIAALTAFFPLLVSVVTGLRLVEISQVRLMRAAGASKWQVFRMVALPNALPTIFGGLQVAIVLSVIGAVVGEFVGASSGIGYYILFANARLDTASMFAGFVLLALIGTLLSQIVVRTGRKVVFWREIDKLAGV